MKEHKDLSRNNQNKPLWIREPIVSHLQASLSYWFCRDFRHYMLELDLSRQDDMSKLLSMEFNQENSVQNNTENVILIIKATLHINILFLTCYFSSPSTLEIDKWAEKEP